MAKKIVFLLLFLLISSTILFGQSTMHSRQTMGEVAPTVSRQPQQQPVASASASETTTTSSQPVEQKQAEPAAQPSSQPATVTAPEPAKTESVNPSTTPVPVKHTPKYRVFKIGDSVPAGSLIFTLNNLSVLADNNGEKPEADKTYLALEMKITNNGEDPVAVNPLALFSLKDDNGSSYSPEVNGQLSGKVGTGRDITGQVLFQVPKETKYFTLEIDPSVVGASIIDVEISLDK